MILFRYLAGAALVSALLAGCSQSLFADGDGDGDGNGRADGGPGPGEPDAGPDRPDGGMMPVVPDAGGDIPDATKRDECPSPCAGDAFGEFYTMQGGQNERWRYVEVQSDQPDSPYIDMVSAILPGPAVGWIGSGADRPSIALCNLSDAAGPCQALSKVLALTSANNEPDTYHPGLMWIAPEDGRYNVTGEWQVSSVAPVAPTLMKLTRNSHSDVLHEESPILTTTPYEFDIDIDVVMGDRIVLTATATTEQAVSVGMNVFVTGPLDRR